MQINNDAYAAIWQSKVDLGAGRIEAQIPLILVLRTRITSTEHTKGEQIKRAKTESFVSASSSLHTGEGTQVTPWLIRSGVASYIPRR